jgi:hypothetical protein
MKVVSQEGKLEEFKRRFSISELSSSKETSMALNVGEDTLRKSRSTGYLFGVPAPKHIKIGKQVKYRADDLMTWMENNSLFSEVNSK